jgi:cation:H+ antiporter
MRDVALVIAGVMGLWFGTEIAVRAGGEIGRRLGLSELFLGLTVFAIGTNVSELLVSIQGSLRQLAGVDTSGLVVGNALGSVLAQGGLVLGVIMLLDRSAAATSQAAVRSPLRDAGAWFVALILLAIAASDGEISRLEGWLLGVAYLLYLVALVKSSHAIGRLRSEIAPLHFLWLSVVLLVGLGLVVVSADLVVEHAIHLAERHGVNPTAIGLFAIGMGTSLPELAVSLGAAARGRPTLSLGNVLGSNTFDLLVPLGVGAAIHPLTIGRNSLYIDLPAIGLLATYFTIRIATRGRLGNRDAIVLFGFYAAFALFRMGTFVG